MISDVGNGFISDSVSSSGKELSKREDRECIKLVTSLISVPENSVNN